MEDPRSIRTKLEKDASVSFILDPQLIILYCNEAWDQFAAANGGQGLERECQVGRSIMYAIPAPLRQFFQLAYDTVLSSRQPWEHNYECSSSTVYRRYRMRVYPDPDAPGLVVVNSLIVERPHGEEVRPRDANEFVYTDENGLVLMCCQCRRCRRTPEPTVWDWVPAYVETPPESVTHGICEVCLNLVYPQFAPA